MLLIIQEESDYGFFIKSNNKKKIVSKQDDIKQCYFYVKTNSLLTENIKIGLWKYVDYRFKSRNRGRFTQKILEDMTQDLLEKVCMKHIQDIQYSDIELNEMRYYIKLKELYIMVLLEIYIMMMLI